MKKLYVTVLALFCCFLVHTSSSAQKTVTELTEKWYKDWRKDYLNIHTYNDKGQLVQTIYKYFNKDSIHTGSRLQKTYTVEGELREIILNTWNSETLTWEYSEYCQDIFRPGEKMPYAREMHREDADNECRVRGRYLYNSMGQKSTLYFENDCEDNNWGGIGYSWIYDAQGRILECEKYLGVNKNLMSRSTYVYRPDGKVNVEILTQKEWYSNDVDVFRIEYLYDSKNREVQKLEKTWYAGDKTWEDYRRTQNTYNGDGTLAESLSQLLEKGKWVNELRKTYTYTEENESETVQTGNARPQLQVFPVPASDKLCVELPQELPATYRLLNIQGMELQSATLSPGSPAIDVHALAPGLYLLYLRQAENEYSIRFVKQ